MTLPVRPQGIARKARRLSWSLLKAMAPSHTARGVWARRALRGSRDLGRTAQLRVRRDQRMAAPDDWLGQNYLEHFRLLTDKSGYFFERESSGHYARAPGDPRVVAFYLPQFHPIPENDRAWGKGFTEWTNVASGRPRYAGHWQPILPRDLGFYDLRLEAVLEQQIELARRHGIYGFGFHHYWFSGKRLLERPLDVFLSHPEWDFSFVISWANENWTRRWDGHEQDVIVKQEYRGDDPLRFIQDVEPILLDPRYMRQDGKPILLVYRVPALKDPRRWTDVWRTYFRERHDTELYLIAILSFDIDDPRGWGFDAAIDHAPLTVGRKHLAEGTVPPTVDVTRDLLDPDFAGMVFDYRAVARNRCHDRYVRFPHYTSVMPSWDNDARRRGKGSTVFCFENPDLYGHWLDATIRSTPEDQAGRLVFINAWNEWAEGAMLEPSLHYGSAVLNRTVQVISSHSRDACNRRSFPLYGIQRRLGVDVAVVVHLYHTDRWKPIQERLGCLDPATFDLYVTLPVEEQDFADTIMDYKQDATVITVPNRGRDVLPFVHVARRLDAHGYRYLLKLHSKKSPHRRDGDWWFGDLLTKLLPSPEVVGEILLALERHGGMVGPAGHFQSQLVYAGSNLSDLGGIIAKLYGEQRSRAVLSGLPARGFFAGTMFWSTFKAVRPILDLCLMPEDFESERGQYDGTMAHAVERALGIVPTEEGFPVMQSDGHSVRPVTRDDIIE